MAKSRLRVLFTNAPRGLEQLVLVFSGPQKIEKRLETSPGATPAEVTFDLPNGLYAVVAWYTQGHTTYLTDQPLSLKLPGQTDLLIDLAQVHPDDVAGGNL